MIARILGIILPVFVVILVGYFYARRFRPDMSQVNHLSMLILGPALIFSALASKEFDLAANVSLIAGSVGVVLGSRTARVAGRALDARSTTARSCRPTMFNNCGNMGLPLAVLAFGQAGFSAMVALFTISNLLQFTLGIRIIDHHAKLLAVPAQSDGVGDRRSASRSRLTRPPMPEWAYFGIKMVGDALIPVMLISLGVRLFEVRWNDWHIGVIGGIVCPVTGIAMALAAGAAARLSRHAARPAHPLRLAAAGRAELHGGRADAPGARQGRVDRADRQRDVGDLRADRAGAGDR